MKKTIYISFLLLSLFLYFNTLAQDILFIGHPKILQYTRIDFNANNQSWGFLQDKRGYLYNANTDGVLIYDGQSWTKVQLPNTNIARSLTMDDSGRIYVAGLNNIGFLTCDSIGEFKFVNFPFAETRNLGEIWQLTFVRPGHLAFITTDSLYLYNLKSKKLKAIARGRFYPYFIHINGKIAIFGPSTLAYITPGQKTILSKVNLDKRLVDPKKRLVINDILQAFGDKILFLRLDSIFLLDKDFHIIKKAKAPYHVYTYSHAATRDYAILSYPNKGLFIIDKNLKVVNFLDKKAGLGANTHNSLFIDSFGNLWIASDNSIDYVILNSPLSYLDNLYDFDRNRDIFHFKDKFYFIGSYNVKYSPDSILLNPFNSFKTTFMVKGSEGQSWKARKINNHYFITHNTDIFRIDDSLASFLNLFRFNVWDLQQIPNTNKVLIGTSLGGYIATISKDTFNDIKKVINGDIRYYVVDKHQKIWAVINSDSSFFARLSFDSSFSKTHIEKIYNKNDGVEDPYNLYVNYDSQRDRIIISDNKTIKYLDTSKDKFIEFKEITKYFTDPGDELYFVYADTKGNYWVNYVNTNKIKPLKYRIYLFKYRKGKLIFTPYFTGSAIYRDYALNGYTYKKRFVFLPSTNGIVVFDYLHNIDITKFRFNVYLRKIISTRDNSLLWAGNTLNNKGELTSQPPQGIKYRYKHNGLAFYAAAPFFENSESILYSFKLEGLDKDWSPWTTINYREYPFLREGKYTLRIKAKNIYGVESSMITFHFQIAPPWYRSTVAYIIYILILIGLIIVGIRLYTYNLRKRNEKLEKLVRERTREIEMKNIELEQQKEEIQAQAEELAEVNQQLQKLSLIAERTNNAVLLTDKDGNFIWVNPGFTKIFGYTLEELKTLISPNIISQRTPDHIKKLINKSLKEKKTVEYEAQFTTKDGRKIWVHTTLTPVLDENNEVVNLIVIDSDVTKIKEAEQKIRIQNESIKGSIRYAQALQSNILPLKEEFNQYFETFILYKPRDIVSGDFYWISPVFTDSKLSNTQCPVNNQKLKAGDYFFVSVIDCTGHGVPGAFMSIIGNRLLDNIINQNKIHSPARVFEEMDKKLADIFKHTEESHRDGMSGSLCRMDVLCQEDNNPALKITFSGAKANILVYKKKTNKLTLIRGIRRTIGQKFFQQVSFENQVFFLENNDIIFLFTDGYKDQNNNERVRLGMKKFQQIILENIDRPMEELKNELEAFLLDWMKGTEQRDDITVIGLRIKI